MLALRGLAPKNAKVWLFDNIPQFLQFGVKTLYKVAIFNVALTEDEIKSIMTKGLKSVAAVSLAGKLATAWGVIKKR